MHGWMSQDSEFCFSPLGQHGGDPDRYGAGIMFGCLPLMLASSGFGGEAVPNALPLEEVLPWHAFGSIVDVTHMYALEQQLRCLAPRAPAMRAALERVWRRFLYSSLYGKSYLGEDAGADAAGGGDAFHGIMEVLGQRAAHGFVPPPDVAERMRQRATVFPCRDYCVNNTEYGPCY